MSRARLARHGEPDSLEAPARLPCLVFGSPEERRWRCGRASGPALPVSVAFASDDMDVLRQAAVAGLGFVLLPRFVAGRDVRAGALRVLELTAGLAPEEVSAVYPGHRVPRLGARALAAFLQGRMTGLPDWTAERLHADCAGWEGKGPGSDGRAARMRLPGVLAGLAGRLA